MHGVMEVGYKRDLSNNYMVIEKETDKDYYSFCIKMLQKQEIKGILSVEQRRIDNKLLLYYDITAKQAISNILDKSTLSIKSLRTLCSGIINAIEISYEYLLPEDDFILAPDFIYQDISSETPFLCLYPGYGINIMEQLGGLMEFLMNKVDYNDKDAVYLVYRLYAVSKEEGYTLEHFKEVLLEKDKSIQEKSKRSRENTSDCFSRIDIPVNNSFESKQNREERPYLHNRADQLTENNIPVVMEKVEGEAEVSCYSMLSFVYAGACILAGIAALVMCIMGKLIYNSLGTRIDYSKLAALIIVLGCVEGYIISKIFDKKNKVTKIVKINEYIDPRSGKNAYPISDNTSKKQSIRLLADKLKLTKESHSIHSDNPIKKAVSYLHEGDYVKTVRHTRLDGRLKGSKNKYENTKINTADIMVNTCITNRTNNFTKEKTYSEANVYVDTHVHADTGSNNLADTLNAANDINGIIRRKNDDTEGMSPTCLLNASPDTENMPVLKALDKINYKDIPVTTYPFFIGKLKKNVDFCLNSDTVSRYHAKITKEGENIFLTDLNSTNGTYINDEPLFTYQKKELNYGDIITFADIKYQFMQE